MRKASQRGAERFAVSDQLSGDVLTCSKKRKFRHKQLAKDAAAVASRGGVPVRTYECPVCHHWHLTSSDQAVERERRRGA